MNHEKKIQELIDGYRHTTLIATAVRLKILDTLGDAPRSPKEIAAELKLQEAALTRFLRGLSLLGLVHEQLDSGGGANRFILQPAGRLLQTQGNCPLREYALLAEQQYLPAWRLLDAALHGKENPFQNAFGSMVWDYRQTNPAAGTLFNDWLHAQSGTLADELADALPISPTGTIADIGGGLGILLSKVLLKHPDCRGVLAEQASVLLQAEAFLGHHGLAGRCLLAETDFLVAVPPGCDCYLLKSVLHNWNDRDAARILKSVHSAMEPAARLIIIERLLPALATEDPAAVWMDLHMLNVLGGAERTLDQYQVLLRESGLDLKKVSPAVDGFRMIEATKV